MRRPGSRARGFGGRVFECSLRVCCGLLILATAACTDMYDQPSFKAQEAPRLLPPEGAVPTTGREVIGWETALRNPVPRTRSSLSRGAHLYEINCAMCHGTGGHGDGPVGLKFAPPPPALLDDRVQQLSDADIFKRISLGFGRMPAFKRRISPEERWDVVNFVRELNQGTAGGP